MLLFWDPWQQIASPSQNPLCPFIQCLIIGMSCADFQSFWRRPRLSPLMRQLRPNIDSVAFFPGYFVPCSASQSPIQFLLPLLCSSFVFPRCMSAIFSFRFSLASFNWIASQCRRHGSVAPTVRLWPKRMTFYLLKPLVKYWTKILWTTHHLFNFYLGFGLVSALVLVFFLETIRTCLVCSIKITCNNLNQPAAKPNQLCGIIIHPAFIF